jgi:hypothetical protein
MTKSSHRSTKEVATKEARAPDKSRRTTEHVSRWAREDMLLDEALDQTFPASDPLSSMRPGG